MNKRTVLFIVILGIALFMTSACSRDTVKEPSPEGPSTTYLTFYLTASPNYIYAGTDRPTSEIKAVIKNGNVPILDAVVYFSILSGPGYFPGSTKPRRIAIRSDENGAAIAVFIGPLKSEITDDQDVIIRAQLETVSPLSAYKDVSLRILRASD